MDQTTLQQTIAILAPSAVFNNNPQFVEAVIPASELHQVAKALKENADTQFDFLFNQTGLDQKGELKVVYHLRSTKLNHACVLKAVTANRENPELDTVSDIWAAAEFYEREIYDLMGIRFANHPDLRRLFLEDDFQGFPLRKDFVDNINIIQF